MILVQEARLFPLELINFWPKYGIRAAEVAEQMGTLKEAEEVAPTQLRR